MTERGRNDDGCAYVKKEKEKKINPVLLLSMRIVRHRSLAVFFFSYSGECLLWYSNLRSPSSSALFGYFIHCHKVSSSFLFISNGIRKPNENERDKNQAVFRRSETEEGTYTWKLFPVLANRINALFPCVSKKFFTWTLDIIFHDSWLNNKILGSARDSQLRHQTNVDGRRLVQLQLKISIRILVEQVLIKESCDRSQSAVNALPDI